MPSERPDPDAMPCSVCGVVLRDAGSGSATPLADPLLTTPVARLCAVALESRIAVLDLDADATDGLAGAVGVGVDQDGELRGMVALADDLDDALRADVLAFGIAVYISDAARLVRAEEGYLGIGRERLPETGIGHLAWHIARSCGTTTTSATFELVDD